MEFFITIITIAIGVILYAVQSSGKATNTDAKQEIPKNVFGENFPFPSIPPSPSTEALDDDQGQKYQMEGVISTESTPPEGIEAEAIEDMLVAKTQKSTSIGDEIANKSKKFDVRQAIIYSEILKPRFKEY